MSFNDFVQKHGLKNKAKSNMKNQNTFLSLSLSDIGIYLRDVPFEYGIGTIILHPTKRTHWVAYVNLYYFDSFGCSPPRKLSKFITKHKLYCLFSEYKIQGLTGRRDSYCAVYCFYLFYLTKGLGIDFKSAVLNLYYQANFNINDVTKNSN